jgi:hypothetical protein
VNIDGARASARGTADRLIRSGVVTDQAPLASLVGGSRARVTQVMALLYLAPDIQETILDLPGVGEGSSAIHERDLRAIAAKPGWGLQRRHWSRVDGRGIGAADYRR